MSSFDNDEFEADSARSEAELPGWEEIYNYALTEARYSVNQPQDAQDIAQTVVKRLLERDLQIRSWRAYVRTMIKNIIIDNVRKQESRFEVKESLPEAGDFRWHGVRDLFGNPAAVFKPRDIAIEIAENDLFRTILAEVPSEKREMFIDYLEGMPGAELAQIYGYSSAQSVAQVIGRIKSDLRKKFRDTQPESQDLG
ncbi:MAG: sigma-70 family RNA polymerase sigma factor [Actinobacteria bacterium]|nr:sigma-70 family RNA polymerase sigma factor [Actinomycetota bacterium]